MARSPEHEPQRTRPHPGTSVQIADPSLYDVRVHSDACQPPSIGAEAFTRSQDMAFPSGPTKDQHLAHEATHVVQQRGRVEVPRSP